MHRYALPSIILLGVLLRCGYAFIIRNHIWVDYSLYRLGAEKILQGDLAFTDNLFMVRPPLFPLLVAMLDTQPLLVIAVNILLGSAIIPLTWLLARQLEIPEKLALLAATIVAIDPTSIRYSAAMLAEPLANLLLALAFVSLQALQQTLAPKKVVRWGTAAGAFIALSALARPAAQFFWIPMALWIIFARRRQRFLAVLALIIPGFLGTGLWQLHNLAVFDNSSFSTIGTYNLLYFRAASALYQATGQPIQTIHTNLARQVEEALGNDTSNVTFETRLHHFHQPSPRVQNVMSEIALNVFRQHPLQYLLTTPVGLYRILFWIKDMPLWLSISWNLVFLLVALYGLFSLLQLRKLAQTMFLLIPCLYFLTGTLIVITAEIDTRARVMITPLLAVMAAYGLMCYLNQRRAASARLSPPADN